LKGQQDLFREQNLERIRALKVQLRAKEEELRAAKLRRNDPRIRAIREHKIFGFGSCSPVDETFTDVELEDRLNEEEAVTVAEALKWARFQHELICDQMGWDPNDF
jgi:hypothetical protein